MHIHLSQCCWDIPSIENNGKFNVYRNVKQIFLYLTLISLLSYRWAGEKICTYRNDLAVVFLGTLSDLVTLLSLSIAHSLLALFQHPLMFSLVPAQLLQCRSVSVTSPLFLNWTSPHSLQTHTYTSATVTAISHFICYWYHMPLFITLFFLIIIIPCCYHEN